MTDQPPPQEPDGPHWGPIPEPGHTPPTSPKKKRRWPGIVVGVFAVIFIAGVIGNVVSPAKPASTSVTSSVVTPTSTVRAPTTTAEPATVSVTTAPVTTTTAAPTTTPPLATTTVATTTVAHAAPAPPPVAQSTRTLAPAPPPVTTQSPPQGAGDSCGPDTYVNSDGNCVHRPVSAAAPPPGATAKCNDGTYSMSQHRSGTCSGHGGVAAFL